MEKSKLIQAMLSEEGPTEEDLAMLRQKKAEIRRQLEARGKGHLADEGERDLDALEAYIGRPLRPEEVQGIAIAKIARGMELGHQVSMLDTFKYMEQIDEKRRTKDEIANN